MPITTKPPVDPAKSIEVLQSLFNRGSSGQQFTSATPVAASEARDKQIDEMAHNLDVEKQMNANPKTAGLYATGATPSDLSSLQADAKADPWTGDSAQVLSKFFNPEQQRMEAQKQAQKVQIEAAPNTAKGMYDLKTQELQNKGAMDLANQNRAGTEHLFQMLSGAQNEVPGATGAGAASRIKPNVNAKGELSFSEALPPQMTAQTRTMGETANDILDVLDKTGFVQQAKDLHAKGLFTPVVGGVRQFAAHHGLGTLLGMGDSTAGQLGQFESAKDMLVSAVQRAHAGARGAGNEALAARFEKMLNDTGDLPTFLGELEGVRPFLEQYAGHVNPARALPQSDNEWETVSPAQ